VCVCACVCVRASDAGVGGVDVAEGQRPAVEPALHLRVCVRVRACVRARARACARAHVCRSRTGASSVCVCVEWGRGRGGGALVRACVRACTCVRARALCVRACPINRHDMSFKTV
jgi:hypothetical protein